MMDGVIFYYFCRGVEYIIFPLIIITVLISGESTAKEPDKFALEFGELMGLEGLCSLQLNSAKVNALVDQRIKANDETFMRTFANAMVSVLEKYKGKRTAGKADCDRIRRFALGAGLMQ